MKQRKTVLLGNHGLFYETEIEDVKIVRISPRSYRIGEHNGWICGMTVGFMGGFMFFCFVFGIFGK